MPPTYMVIINIVHLSTVPEPKVTLTKSPSGIVYAGTELVLTLDISFNDFKRVDVNIFISTQWKRWPLNINAINSIQLGNDTRTTVSAVSGSDSSFKASLTYSPITISDSGRHWTNVIVQPSAKSIYMKSLLDSARVDLIVKGV